ncbi:MAG: hypothetical protein RL095_3964 [Verrucomicrobiota bacterium]|jgi:hypothetical protein
MKITLCKLGIVLCLVLALAKIIGMLVLWEFRVNQLLYTLGLIGVAYSLWDWLKAQTKNRETKG